MNHQRIDKIEGLLTPTQSIILWLEEFDEFDTFDVAGRPTLRVREEPVSKNAAHRKASPESERHWRSELCFKHKLVAHLNAKLEILSARVEIASCGVYGILWPVSQDISYRDRVGAILRSRGQELSVDSSIAAAIVAATIQHVTGLNDFAAYLKRCVSLDSRVADKQHGYDQLNEEVQKLCEQHCLNGFSVDLGPTSIGMLRNAPLVEGHWIDQLAIELAEFAQALHTRGFKVGLSKLPISQPQVRTRSGIGGDGADAGHKTAELRESQRGGRSAFTLPWPDETNRLATLFFN